MSNVSVALIGEPEKPKFQSNVECCKILYNNFINYDKEPYLNRYGDSEYLFLVFYLLKIKMPRGFGNSYAIKEIIKDQSNKEFLIVSTNYDQKRNMVEMFMNDSAFSLDEHSYDSNRKTFRIHNQNVFVDFTTQGFERYDHELRAQRIKYFIFDNPSGMDERKIASNVRLFSRNGIWPHVAVFGH